MLKFNLSQFKTTFCRFPVAVILTLVLSALLFLLVHRRYFEANELMLQSGIFATVLAFFLSVSVSLCCREETKLTLGQSLFKQTLPLILGLIFFFRFNCNANENLNTMLFIMLLVGVLAIFFISPACISSLRGAKGRGNPKSKFKKLDCHATPTASLAMTDCNNTNFTSIFLQLAIVLIFGRVLGGISTGLGSLAIGAVDMLFDVDVGSSYAHRAIFALSLFTPFICLTKIPEFSKDSKSSEQGQFMPNLFISFIIKYVLLPFVFIYFIILYIYSINVLIHFSERPRGQVSRLVIVFSIFGYLTYLLSYFFKEIKVVEKFRKLFPIVVLPQLFMLFYAIWLRIGQYDLTINRYFVLIFGGWLLVLSLYFIISRSKLLMVIPASLAGFVVVFSVGPWGVFELPVSRQLVLLEKELRKAEILVDGELYPLEKDSSSRKRSGSEGQDDSEGQVSKIDPNLEGEIYERIGFICEYSCDRLVEILGQDNINKIKAEYNSEANPYSYGYISPNELTSRKVTQYLNVNYRKVIRPEEARLDISKIPTFSVSVLDPEGFFPIETAGYNFIDDVSIESVNNSVFEVEYGGESEWFDISEVMSGIYSKIDKTKYTSSLSKKDLTFQFSGEIFDVKLMIQGADLNNPDYQRRDDRDDRAYLYGWILMNIKKSEGSRSSIGQ